jgi:hypothetical protein
MAEQAVVIRETVTPATLLQLAVEKGVDIEKLSQLMDLKIKWEANQARKAYHIAMAAFKSNLPTVTKDKTNVQYKSKYASEDALINTINPELSKNGLSASFDFDQTGDDIKVTCHITHAEGHRESVSLSGKADGSGSKNPLQQIKSTTTYLRKATFEAITGIASSENKDDDDGNGSGTTKYIDEQKTTIVDMFNTLEHNAVQKGSFFKTAEIEPDDFGKIKAAAFGPLMVKLRATQQAKGKGKK